MADFEKAHLEVMGDEGQCTNTRMGVALTVYINNF